MPKQQHTPGPWHVNGIDSKRGRITGDETSTGWDKLQIHGANATVATVYRPKDARLIAAAPRMLAHLSKFLNAPSGTPICACKNVNAVNAGLEAACWYCEARAILCDVEG